MTDETLPRRWKVWRKISRFLDKLNIVWAPIGAILLPLFSFALIIVLLIAHAQGKPTDWFSIVAVIVSLWVGRNCLTWTIKEYAKQGFEELMTEYAMKVKVIEEEKKTDGGVS